MVSKLRNPTGAPVFRDETNPLAVAEHKTSPQLVAKLSMGANWFKPKKASVFPAKRRLVKTMVFRSILKFVASGFCSIREANTEYPNAKSSSQSQIFPDLDDEQFVIRHGY